MIAFVIRRVIATVLVMFALSVLVFLIFFATPGVDPASRIAGRNADPATLKQVLIGAARTRTVGAALAPPVPAWSPGRGNQWDSRRLMLVLRLARPSQGDQTSEWWSQLRRDLLRIELIDDRKRSCSA